MIYKKQLFLIIGAFISIHQCSGMLETEIDKYKANLESYNNLNPLQIIHKTDQYYEFVDLKKLNQELYSAILEKKGLEYVQTLLEKGAQPNTQDNLDWAQLHYTCKNGDHEIFDLFHELITMKDRDGKIP